MLNRNAIFPAIYATADVADCNVRVFDFRRGRTYKTIVPFGSVVKLLEGSGREPFAFMIQNQDLTNSIYLTTEQGLSATSVISDGIEIPKHSQFTLGIFG